jgi:amino acid adenylation domain-containing protein
MTATQFRLPSAWLSTAAGAAAAEVPHDDLTPAMLAAAHLTVLSMLTEERAFRTDLRLDGIVRSARVAQGAQHSWLDVLALVERAEPVPAHGGEPDRVLFTTDAAAGDGYGLCVSVHEGTLSLRTRAIGRDHLARLAAMYRTVLAALAEDTGAGRAHLPAEDRDAVLSRWARGPATDRARHTVVDLVEAQADRTPGAPAVRAGGKTLAFAELDARANQIAHRLLGLGVRTETPVGVCLRRTTDLLPTILGIWKAGGAYLPLDPDLPAQRLHHMITAADCALVVTETDHLPVLDGHPVVLLDAERESIAALPTFPTGMRTRPEQLAYVIYTSGSTGAPKGVLVQHASLANYLLWTVAAYAARGDGGSPFFTSISFDLGMPSLLTPLLVGQPVTLLPDPLDPADLGALLTESAPYGFVKLTPGHLNLLSLDLTAEQARDLAGVVIAAGDAFPAALARRWTELAGPDGTAVATEYGPTEITVGNSGQLIADTHPDGLIPLGAPIQNTTMYVLTPALEPVPVGVPGEVHVGGAGVARGYLGDPALTADRFVPDPYGRPGARLYRTGDRARWQPDGALEFLGRTDHQVKIRGYRVEPAEVRAALRRGQHVSDAVVVAHDRPNRPTCLVAFVVADDGQVLDPPRLRADLAADLPDHMVPAEIVPVEEIPLTANGKVDTRALRSLL